MVTLDMLTAACAAAVPLCIAGIATVLAAAGMVELPLCMASVAFAVGLTVTFAFS